MFAFALISAAIAASPSSGGIKGLAHVETFTMSEPGHFAWNVLGDEFISGTMVVVKVDKEMARVRQVGGPVLFIGTTPAARLNPGHVDGHVVAYVPGTIDLSVTPVFWGPSVLPEQVDPATQGEQFLRESGAKPFTEEMVDRASRPTKHLPNQKGVQRMAADLIDLYAPADADFARGYRAKPLQVK